MRSPHPTDAAPMHLMTYRGFVGEVERDAERGLFVGTLTDIPDTVRFQGPRLVLLAAAMARTVDEYIARRQEWGLPCDRPFIDDRRVRLGAVRKPPHSLAAAAEGRQPAVSTPAARTARPR